MDARVRMCVFKRACWPLAPCFAPLSCEWEECWEAGMRSGKGVGNLEKGDICLST